MVMVATPDHFHPVERALQQVKWLPVGFQHHVFQQSARRQFADAEDGRARRTDHLQGAFFAGQKRNAQRLLPLDHPLERRFSIAPG